MAAEDQAQELLMRAGEAGVRIVVDVARLGVGRLFDVLGIGVRAAGESLRHLRDAGRVSVRCLQRMGQPVTVQEVTGPPRRLRGTGVETGRRDLPHRAQPQGWARVPSFPGQGHPVRRAHRR